MEYADTNPQSHKEKKNAYGSSYCVDKGYCNAYRHSHSSPFMEKVNDEALPIAIVTGSTKGIGKATARLLANKGCNVVICSRSQDDIDKTVKEIKSAAGAQSVSTSKPLTRVMGLKCDVHNSSEVNSLVESTMESFGRIDVLINNAGILLYKNFVDISEEEWAKTININLTGTFLFCKTVLPYTVKSKSGVIINVCSGGGKMGFPSCLHIAQASLG